MAPYPSEASEPGVLWVLWKFKGYINCVCVYVYIHFSSLYIQNLYHVLKGFRDSGKLKNHLFCLFFSVKQKEWELGLESSPPFPLHFSTYSQVPWLPQALPLEFPVGGFPNSSPPPTLVQTHAMIAGQLVR